MFTSEAIGVLLADEAGEDALDEGGPGGHGEDFAAEVDGLSEEGLVVGGGAEEEAGEAGGGFVAGGIGGESRDLGAEAGLPPGAEDAIGFEPHRGVAVPIEAVCEGAGSVFAGEEIANTDGQGAAVRENGGGEDSVGKMVPAGAGFQL